MEPRALLASFLKRLWTTWFASSEASASKPAEPLAPEEPLSRFLLSDRDISHGGVKPAAFLPAPDGTTSVFRIQELSEPEVWRLGDQYVARPRGRRLHGRGDLKHTNVTATGLRVEPDNSPPRHAAIVGWPDEKDAQMSVAQQLASTAVLRLHRPEIP